MSICRRVEWTNACHSRGGHATQHNIAGCKAIKGHSIGAPRGVRCVCPRPQTRNFVMSKSQYLYGHGSIIAILAHRNTRVYPPSLVSGQQAVIFLPTFERRSSAFVLLIQCHDVVHQNLVSLPAAHLPGRFTDIRSPSSPSI